MIDLMEDGYYETELGNDGDGVKRAFILAALQRLEAAKAQTEEERSDHSKLPSLHIRNCGSLSCTSIPLESAISPRYY